MTVCTKCEEDIGLAKEYTSTQRVIQLVIGPETKWTIWKGKRKYHHKKGECNDKNNS